MKRSPFTLNDIAAECQLTVGPRQLDGSPLGLSIEIPSELHNRYPYNASAYVWMQELRASVFEYGLLEFPNLPINPTNHTVAMRHPQEHSYSDNPYLNSFFQSPHQDTPPYPTAFWLDHPRRYAATWTMSLRGVERWSEFTRQNPQLGIEALHRELVAESLNEGWGLLLNQQPGLLIMDNSGHHNLYHARTCNFAAIEAEPDHSEDAPVYTFSEIGLLNYFGMIDSRRGTHDLCAEDRQAMEAFMREEKLGS